MGWQKDREAGIILVCYQRLEFTLGQGVRHDLLFL